MAYDGSFSGASTPAATSTDGINWTSANKPLGEHDAVAYGNGTFVAVGWSAAATFS